MNSAPFVIDLCLIGGGHSHALVLRQWAMNPIPGVRVTLISTDSQTPYSGMLPGLIAGHYTKDDIHIDLRRLCTWANVRFIEHSVVALDLTHRSAKLDNGVSIGFDVLSLDTGSTPDLSVNGAREYATPVKPVYTFYSRWVNLLSQVNCSSNSQLSIGVVGSGAGGFELVMAIRHALPEDTVNCYWFIRGEAPLRGRPSKVGKLALQAAKREG